MRATLACSCSGVTVASQPRSAAKNRRPQQLGDRGTAEPATADSDLLAIAQPRSRLVPMLRSFTVPLWLLATIWRLGS